MSQLNDIAAKAATVNSKREVEELYQRALDVEDGPASESLLALLCKLDRLWLKLHLRSLTLPRRRASDRP